MPQNDKEWIATPTARNDMDTSNSDMSLRGGLLSDEVIHEAEEVNDTTATRHAELVSASPENVMLNEREASQEILRSAQNDDDGNIDSSASPQNDGEWIATPTARNNIDTSKHASHCILLTSKDIFINRFVKFCKAI